MLVWQKQPAPGIIAIGTNSHPISNIKFGCIPNQRTRFHLIAYRNIQNGLLRNCVSDRQVFNCHPDQGIYAAKRELILNTFGRRCDYPWRSTRPASFRRNKAPKLYCLFDEHGSIRGNWSNQRPASLQTPLNLRINKLTIALIMFTIQRQ